MKPKLTFRKSIALSSFAHAFGIALLAGQISIPDKLSIPEHVEWIDLKKLASSGNNKGNYKETCDGSGNGMFKRGKMDSDLEGYVEKEISSKFHAEAYGVPQKYLTREHHYSRMLSDDIFSGLDYLEKKIPDVKKPRPKVEMYLPGMSIEHNKTEKRKEPLSMTDHEMQALLDELMPQPKEKQLEKILEYTDRYDNNNGNLPKLAGELYRQNMIRVLHHLSEKENLINRFEEMLNKPSVYERSYNYLQENPDTKVAVETLFFLDITYDITLQAARDTRDYGKSNNQNKDIQQEVINRLLDSLEDRLGDTNITELSKMVINKRKELLSRVLEIGNYRVNDALFLLAAISNEENDQTTANAYISKIDLANKDGSIYEKYYQIAKADPSLIRTAFKKHEIDFHRLIDARGKRLIWGEKEE